MAENLPDTNVGNIEYIRKDVALDALKAQADTMRAWVERYDEQRRGILTAVNIIEDVKPDDVVPVVHAYWIRHDDADVVEGYYVPEYECSKCRAWKKDDSDFCPDCGAKMDEEV